MTSTDCWDQLGAEEPPHSYSVLANTSKQEVLGCVWQQWCLVPNNNTHTDGAQRAARVKKKKQKSSNLSTVRGGFHPRGLIVLHSSNIDFLPRRLPSQEVCLCALESGEVCVVWEGRKWSGFGHMYAWLRKISVSASIKIKSWRTLARPRSGFTPGQTRAFTHQPL